MTYPTTNIPDPSRDLYERALHAVTGQYGYYDRHWLPLLKGSAGKVIKALLKHVSFNPTTWVKAGTCIPKYETIAKDAGVSRATVARVLERDETGAFCYSWYGEALGPLVERFIESIEHRYRYSKAEAHTLRTSNLYHLAHILPCVPEHDSLVETKRHELEQLQRLAERAASTKNETYNVVSKLDEQRSLKVGLEIVDREISTKDDPSIAQSTSVVARSTTGNTPHQDANRGETDRQENRTRSTGNESNRIEQESEVAARRPVAELIGMPASALLSEQEIRELEADAIAGAQIESIARQLGDTNAPAARKCIISALVSAGCPMGALVDAARLGKNRVARFQSAGGHVPPGNTGGYYLVVMRNLARECRNSRGWNIAKIDAAEKVKHQARLNAQWGVR